LDDKVWTFIVTTLNLAAVLTFCWNPLVSTVRIDVGKGREWSSGHEICTFLVHWSSLSSRWALEVWMPIWHRHTHSDPEGGWSNNAIRVIIISDEGFVWNS
jgi:hypothetical protein